MNDFIKVSIVFSLKKTNWGHYLHIKIYLSYIKLKLFINYKKKKLIRYQIYIKYKNLGRPSGIYHSFYNYLLRVIGLIS